jgi:hypothetical protein
MVKYASLLLVATIIVGPTLAAPVDFDEVRRFVPSSFFFFRVYAEEDFLKAVNSLKPKTCPLVKYRDRGFLPDPHF